MSETRQLFESFQNNLNEEKLEESTLNEAKVDLSKLINELEAEMKKYMTGPEIGFDAERNPNDKYNVYYGDCCEIKVETDEDGNYLIRANAELGYDNLTGLADRLDKIVSKYDKDAYFEAEDSGRLVCYMSKKLIKESALKEDDSFYNELEVTKYRPTGQTEGALANMTIKSKFGELNVNLLNIDGEYRIVTPNMWRTKEEEELIDNLVNEYGIQGLVDFAADYHYKKSHMNESALNESVESDIVQKHIDTLNKELEELQNNTDSNPDLEVKKDAIKDVLKAFDFIVFITEKQIDYKASRKKLEREIRRLTKSINYHPINSLDAERRAEYYNSSNDKERRAKLKEELKKLNAEEKEYLNSEEYKEEINAQVDKFVKEHLDKFVNEHLDESDSSNEKYSYIETLKKELEKVQNSIGNADPNKDISGLEEKRDWLMDKLNDLEEGDSLQDVRKDSIEKGLLSEDYNPLPLKLFMNTWGNYNENGADVDSIGGGWMDIEQVKDFLEKHSDEEPFINDVDGWTPFEINEYSNVEQVIEWLEAYENLSANEQEAFAAIMEDQNDDFESTMNILDSGDYIFFAGVDNEEDLGEAWYDMVGGYDGISNPENYIDEDAYKESWREAAEEDIRNENPDIDEDSDEFEDLVQNWLDTVALEELQNEIASGADLSEYFDYEALGNDLYNDGFYFATTGAIQTL